MLLVNNMHSCKQLHSFIMLISIITFIAKMEIILKYAITGVGSCESCSNYI